MQNCATIPHPLQCYFAKLLLQYNYAAMPYEIAIPYHTTLGWLAGWLAGWLTTGAAEVLPTDAQPDARRVCLDERQRTGESRAVERRGHLQEPGIGGEESVSSIVCALMAHVEGLTTVCLLFFFNEVSCARGTHLSVIFGLRW